MRRIVHLPVSPAELIYSTPDNHPRQGPTLTGHGLLLLSIGIFCYVIPVLAMSTTGTLLGSKHRRLNAVSRVLFIIGACLIAIAGIESFSGALTFQATYH
jgi:hypothetical protein